MHDTQTVIQQVDAASASALAPQLVALLQDAVAGGASLGFWRPLDADRARAYWGEIIAELAAGQRRLLVALREGAAVGSVQLAPASKQNAVHRAEIQKLMTLRAARRQGIGQALMRAVERLADAEGRTLLVLDTATGSDAERLYRALGYQQAGVIPRYVVEADGEEYSTTLFYKSLITERQATPQNDTE
ncbi:MAG TPA: GNAT family N-acetyltransferase [Ktedonobacterales bacterium]